MISKACDPAEFFRKVETHDVLEMIYTAEQKATSVERILYHPNRCNTAKRTACREYAEALKSLIGYFRYPIRPPVSETLLEHFQHSETAIERNRASMFDAPTT